MKTHTTGVLVVVAVVTGVVALAWRAASPPRSAGFGPASGESPHEERVDAAEPRVAPKYAGVAEAGALALDVIRTRMDSGDPAEQNWEVALEVVRADPASADSDEVYAAWMTVHDEFLYVIIDYAPALVAVLVLFVPGLVRRECASAWVVAGILVSFAAAAVQAARLAPHPMFNHNDLYHVIQMAAFWLLYRGGVLLRDR